MKGLAYSTTGIFMSLTLLGILFKTMHWPGANIALVLGIAGLSLIAVPAMFIYKYRTAA